MARKNLIGIFSPDEVSDKESLPVHARPIAGIAQTTKTPLAVGGITKSLDSITQKIERAEELERQLAHGEAIVELDPASLVASFVKDRMSIDPISLAQLTEQIQQHGQQVPILVRPHPTVKDRYQIAFGHRRAAAAQTLGIKVKAVIKKLTDDQLVVSQGQENNARENLSYIEKSLFANALEDLNFSRDTIMSALSVDKAALSKMITVVRGQPRELIDYIGPAPEIGRRRWLELVDLLKASGEERVIRFIHSPEGQDVSCEDRFRAAVDIITSKPSSQVRQLYEPIEGVPVQHKMTNNGAVMMFDTKVAPGFDEFVRARLSTLFNEYTRKTGD